MVPWYAVGRGQQEGRTSEDEAGVTLKRLVSAGTHPGQAREVALSLGE